MKLYSLFICCEVNCCVREQPQTRSEVSFPKCPKSLILVDEEETLPETPLGVKSSHLALYFNHLQRRRDGFAEKSCETDTHETLRPRQPVVLFH